ncbi:hypothetical protein NOL13_04705 [Streptococcus suis]|uniref:Glutathione peroxidase n=1 Tax=Streptococcus suis TaxID=1307 RepID=A0A9X4MSQ1_STRSU|nr:hypothetical protein [Streptococcus suis]
MIRLDLECKTRTNLPINHCAEMLTQTLRSGPGLFAQPHRGQGFVVLDFPCNQFLNQASGSAEDINQICSLNYGTTFPRFAKIAVNGSEASPLYRYLKKEKSTLLGGRIEWNFTKFLVDRQGRVVKRYLPTTSPLKLKEDIELYLEK